MQRRSFLAGILAGCAAPAIVRAESLMKLWVPPQNLVLDGPEWFYLNKQGENLMALADQIRRDVDKLCGMPDWALKANDPAQQARADRMEAQIREIWNYPLLQRKLDESDAVRKALDDMRRG